MHLQTILAALLLFLALNGQCRAEERQERSASMVDQSGTTIRVVSISRTVEACYFLRSTAGVPIFKTNVTRTVDSSTLRRKVVEMPECPAGHIFLFGKCETYVTIQMLGSCPAGYVQSSIPFRCVRYSEARCKPNFNRVGDLCIFEETKASVGNMANQIKRIPLVCPAGFQIFLNLCAKFADSKDAYTCPNGFVRSQGRCLIWDHGSCPTGYSRDGETCVSSEPPQQETQKISEVVAECPSGYEMVGDNYCYQNCPRGYKRYFSNLCISEGKHCPPNFNNNGKDQCVMISCPSGLAQAGSSCTESCPAGYTADGNGLCISKSTQCPTGYVLQGRVCIKSECPKGFTRHDSGCISEQYLKCPQGYELFNTVCRRCVASNRTNGVCQNWEFICSNGWYKVSDSRCALTCPADTAALGYHCVGIRTTGCPNGSLHIPGQGCHNIDRCPQNYEQVGRECIYNKQDLCKKFLVNGACTDRCPNGYVEFDGSCYLVTQTGCPQGFFLLDDRFCVPVCPKDFTMDYYERRCVATSHCGQLLASGDSCVSTCPTNMRPDFTNKVCIIRENLCATGSFYYAGTCITGVNCEHMQGRTDSSYGICQRRLGCKPGTYEFGPHCLNKCPLGFEGMKDICVPKVSPQCPNGVIHDGSCLKDCPTGHVARFGVCVTIVTVDKNKIEVDVDKNATTTRLVSCGINMDLVDCAKDENCKNKCVCQPEHELFAAGGFCLPSKKVCSNNNPIDIVFVVDLSQVAATTEVLKNFLLESLSHVYASNKKSIRVGLVLVGGKELDITYLHTHQSRCAITDTLSVLKQGIARSQNITSVSVGIRVARDFILSQCNGARIGVSRMVIVVSPDTKLYSASEVAQITDEAQLCSQIGQRVAFMTVGSLTGLPSSAYNVAVNNVNDLMTMCSKTGNMVCHDFKCPSGYEKVGDECIDVNECKRSPCHQSAVCINEPGTFKCYCPPGFYYADHKQGCLNESTKCTGGGKIEAKNVCDVIQCVGQAKCVNHNGMGYCLCPPGYVYSASLGCVDHNECSQSPCLDNATCINTNGSFECRCPVGFQYNKHFGCVDVDECKTLTSPCSGNGNCRNLIGSYDCICKEGYEYIEKVGCKDIDECKLNSKVCVGDKVTCQNTEGAYKCVCPTGFAYTQSGCRDIDECVEWGAEVACGKGAFCTNQEPGYACTCPKGYLHDATKKQCILDQTLNAIERKADLVFLLDLSDRMSNTGGTRLEIAKVLIINLVESYRTLSANINTTFSLLVMSKGSDVTTVVSLISLDKVNDTITAITIKGGSSDHSKGIQTVETFVKQQGRANSTKIVYLITATELPTDSTQLLALKKNMESVRKVSQLYIVDLREPQDRSRWLKLFTEEDLDDILFLMDAAFWKTMYKLIYTRSISKVTCPSGFILLDNVCQYISSQSRYCKFDQNLYAVNTTWNNHCAQYQCTEEGVTVLEKKCMGYDGDCYGENEFFPALVGGTIKWQARCQTLTTKESSTGKLQQKVTLLVVEFDRETVQKEAETEDGIVCQFPFKFRDAWYYACTDARSSTRWCSHTQFYDGQYSYCKRNVMRQCVVNGTVYKEGDVWRDGCNDLYCQAGSVGITAKCETSDGKCVPLMQTSYGCVVDGKNQASCICLQDSRGYGKNSVVGGTRTEEKIHETELLVVCENKVTGERYKNGADWVSECHKMRCDDGKVTVLERSCPSTNKKCYKPGDKDFPCTINGKTYGQCSCVVGSGNNLVLTATEQGQMVEERAGGHWKMSFITTF